MMGDVHGDHTKQLAQVYEELGTCVVGDPKMKIGMRVIATPEDVLKPQTEEEMAQGKNAQHDCNHCY